jgi:hypothetical protein
LLREVLAQQRNRIVKRKKGNKLLRNFSLKRGIEQFCGKLILLCEILAQKRNRIVKRKKRKQIIAEFLTQTWNLATLWELNIAVKLSIKAEKNLKKETQLGGIKKLELNKLKKIINKEK